VSKNPIKTKKKKRTPKDGGESFEQTNADVGTGTSQITDNDDPGTSRITNKFVENDPLKDGGESFEQTNAGTSASTDKNEQSAKFVENDLEQKVWQGIRPIKLGLGSKLAYYWSYRSNKSILWGRLIVFQNSNKF
jgi:hypothetical protein